MTNKAKIKQLKAIIEEQNKTIARLRGVIIKAHKVSAKIKEDKLWEEENLMTGSGSTSTIPRGKILPIKSHD